MPRTTPLNSPELQNRVFLLLVLMTISVTQDAAAVCAQVKSGELNPAEYFQQLVEGLPTWLRQLLDRVWLADVTAAHLGWNGDQRPGHHPPGPDHRPDHAGLFRQLFPDAVPALLPAAGRADDFEDHRRRDPAAAAPQAVAVCQVSHRGARHRQGQYFGGADPGRAGRAGPGGRGCSRGAAVGRRHGRSFAAAGDRRRHHLGADRAVVPDDGSTLAGIRPDPVGRSGDRLGRQPVAPAAGRQGHQAAGLPGADLDSGRHGDLRPERIRDWPHHRGPVRRRLGHL
jgi:hypothetical protein